MADDNREFGINVITTYDGKGMRQAGTDMDAIARRQAAAEAKWAVSPINPKNQTGGGIAGLGGGPTPSGGGGAAAGFGGTAVAIGTIFLALNRAWNEWQKFQDELDKAAEAMLKSQEKMRALGESIIETQDQAISLERIGVEPLAQSFERLQREIAVTKAEQKLLDLPSQGEEWKKLNKEIAFNQSLLDKVTASIERQAAAEEKARQQQEKKQEEAFGAASPQAKAILENEKRARETGDQAFQKTADQLRKSATPADLAAVQAVTDAYGKAPELSDIEKNKKAFEEGVGAQNFNPTGATGPSLIGDEARKAREASERKDDLGLADEVGFQKQQALLRTAHESKMAAQDRDAANQRLAAENQAGTIEKQTQNANRNPDRDTTTHELLQKILDQFR